VRKPRRRLARSAIEASGGNFGPLGRSPQTSEGCLKRWPLRILADRLRRRGHLCDALKDCVTRWKTDSRKACANKKADRAGARKGIRFPDCVVGS